MACRALPGKWHAGSTLLYNHLLLPLHTLCLPGLPRPLQTTFANAGWPWAQPLTLMMMRRSKVAHRPAQERRTLMTQK